jgi:hypothetical protein
MFPPSPTRPLDSYSPGETSFVTFVPKLLVIFAVLTLIVNGALPQVEMAVTGGSLLFMPRQLTLLILALASMLLLKGRFQHSSLLPLTLVLACYFLIEALFLHFVKDISYPAIRTSLECFVFLAIVGAASAVPLQIRSRHILGFLIAISLACLVISAAQFITNTPVVRTESSDSYFHVQSYQFVDQTRGFSLFTNGLEAGLFYSFMGGIATSFCLRRGSRRIGFILLPLCAFGCYVTYTRLAIVGFIVTFIAVFVLSRRGLSKLSLLLPVFSLLCALLIIIQGLRTEGGAARTDLVSASSLDTRIVAWGIYTGKFMAGSRTDILFGIGQGPYTPYTAPNRLENSAPIPIDNAYLLSLLSCGVCGSLLLGVTYWKLWMFLHQRTIHGTDHLVKGIAGIFAALPFFCCINDLPSQIILLLLFAVSLRKEDEEIPAATDLALDEQHLRLA